MSTTPLDNDYDDTLKNVYELLSPNSVNFKKIKFIFKNFIKFIFISIVFLYIL